MDMRGCPLPKERVAVMWRDATVSTRDRWGAHSSSPHRECLIGPVCPVVHAESMVGVEEIAGANPWLPIPQTGADEASLQQMESRTATLQSLLEVEEQEREGVLGLWCSGPQSRWPAHADTDLHSVTQNLNSWARRECVPCPPPGTEFHPLAGGHGNRCGGDANRPSQEDLAQGDAVPVGSEQGIDVAHVF